MGKIWNSNFQTYDTTNLLDTSSATPDTLPISAAYIIVVIKYIMQNINYYIVALSKSIMDLQYMLWMEPNCLFIIPRLREAPCQHTLRPVGNPGACSLLLNADANLQASIASGRKCLMNRAAIHLP
jgi:hypothetical protein